MGDELSGQPAAPRAVVALSGGLDSAATLAVARSEGCACHCLSVDYGQRHRFELTAAAQIARSLGAAEHRLLKIDLRSFGGSALTADIPVPQQPPTPHEVTAPTGPPLSRKPEAGSREPKAIPITYVPARNLILLSLAGAFAEVLGASEIFIGVNAVDYSGYPDCRPEFIRSFQQTLNLGTKVGSRARNAQDAGRGDALRIRAPLLNLSKAQIIALGDRLGVDLSLTHSCYDPDDEGRACRRCESCRIRARGFVDAGIPDPTRYR